MFTGDVKFCICIVWRLFFVHCFIIQALSKRIHYGKFVAEAKFQESPEVYSPAIKAQVCAFCFSLICLLLLCHFFISFKSFFCFTCEFQIKYDNWILVMFQDPVQLMQLLTYETVERAIEHRVEAKAKIFGQEVKIGAEDTGAPPVYKINPSLVAGLYRRIMPLTKEVQVAYLLRRLD